jgi:hypothetical protein
MKANLELAGAVQQLAAFNSAPLVLAIPPVPRSPLLGTVVVACSAERHQLKIERSL